MQQTTLTPSHGSTLSLSELGAKIELQLNDIPILGSFTRGDGKGGVTHPCTPVFGPDRNNLYGLKQHGNMRNEICEVTKERDSISIKHMITDVGYPQGVQVIQIFNLTNGVFTCQTTHTNNGSEKAAINFGEHCYFDAPKGFEGTLINRQDVTELIQNNWDGVAIHLKEVNTIQIPGKPLIVLKQKGLSSAMLWVGKNPESKRIDQTYICIEPVESDPNSEFFGSEGSMILPGEMRSVQFSLELS